MSVALTATIARERRRVGRLEARHLDVLNDVPAIVIDEILDLLTYGLQ
jgi:hypothetical protein